MSTIQNFEKTFFGGTTLETAAQETGVKIKNLYTRKLGVYEGIAFTITDHKKTKSYKIVLEYITPCDIVVYSKNITKKQKQQLERISFCISYELASLSKEYRTGRFAEFELKRNFNKRTTNKKVTPENFWDDKLMYNKETKETEVYYKDTTMFIRDKKVMVSIETNEKQRCYSAFKALELLGYNTDHVTDIKLYSLA